MFCRMLSECSLEDSQLSHVWLDYCMPKVVTRVCWMSALNSVLWVMVVPCFCVFLCVVFLDYYMYAEVSSQGFKVISCFTGCVQDSLTRAHNCPIFWRIFVCVEFSCKSSQLCNVFTDYRVCRIYLLGLTAVSCFEGLLYVQNSVSMAHDHSCLLFLGITVCAEFRSWGLTAVSCFEGLLCVQNSVVMFWGIIVCAEFSHESLQLSHVLRDYCVCRIQSWGLTVVSCFEGF